MMTIDIEVARWGFWVFLATTAAAYFAWTYVRVFILRNDIYAIRDRLWEDAQKLGAFSDPAYVKTRRQLHSLIENSHRISLPVLIVSRHKTRHMKVRTFTPKSDDPRVTDACSRALDDAASCIKRYVLRHRFFSGFFFLLFLRVVMHITLGVEHLRSMAKMSFANFMGLCVHSLRASLNVGLLSSSFVRFAGLAFMNMDRFSDGVHTR